MRIDRLDLVAFGNFTNARLELTPADRSLQVVLGPNAAGKSTALRAITQLLFGIADRTTDDFVHPMNQLRVGAEISAADGRSLSFMRRKGRKNTLLDPGGKPLDDSVLTGFVGGVGQELFESMFGLGHERLRQGAEDILRAGGALGESLFEAAGGTASIRKVLAWLVERAEEVFLVRGRIPLLNAALARHRDAQERARAATLAGERFRALEDEVGQLDGRLAEIGARLSDLRSDRRRLERLQRNLPRLAKRRDLLDELGRLTDVPELPQEAREERLALVTRRRELERAASAAEATIATLQRELAALQVPEDVLSEGPRIRQLASDLAVVRQAAEDLPKRAVELGRERDEALSLLRQVRAGVELAEAESLRVPDPQGKRIRELAKQNESLRSGLEAAENGLAGAKRDLERAERDLAAAPLPRDVAKLTDTVRVVRAEGDLAAQEAETAAKLARLTKKHDAALSALPRWSGSAEDLERAAVPALEGVRGFANRFKKADAEVDRARDRLEQREAELNDVRGKIGRLTAAGDVPTAEQLAAARQHREAGWRLIRRAYVDSRDDVGAAAAAYDPERPLPEAYEVVVVVADALADRMRTDAERVAEYQSLKQREAEAEAQCVEQRAVFEAARAIHARLDEEWMTLWRPAGLQPGFVEEMAAWLQDRSRIVETIETIREESGRLQAVRARTDRSRAVLVAALGEVGESEDIGDTIPAVLLARAERVIQEADEQARRRQTHEQLVRERRKKVEAAEAERISSQRKLEEWASAWRSALEPLGFAGVSSPTEIEASLELLTGAFRRLEKARDLEHRVARMQENAGQFAHAVAQLTGRLAPDLGGQPPERAVEELERRRSRAELDERSRKEKGETLARERAGLEQARRDLANVAEDLEAIVRRARCPSLEEVEAVESLAVRKREVERELRRLAEQVVEDGDGRSLEDVVGEAEGQDGDRVAAGLGEVDRQSADLDEERGGCQTRRGELRREIDEITRASDAAALAAQDARDEAAAIRSLAEEYVRLKLAETVLRDFVERYRERHQSPILERASQLFTELTLRTFMGLRADYDEADQPVVVGVTPDGRALGVGAMSDGTRDQLYLALRLAAVEQHVAAAEPLPFVADDLLVHFDDDRARAAFRVLADFSRKTQVLFFTHHRHLVDLAREVVPAELLAVQELR